MATIVPLQYFENSATQLHSTTAVGQSAHLAGRRSAQSPHGVKVTDAPTIAARSIEFGVGQCNRRDCEAGRIDSGEDTSAE